MKNVYEITVQEIYAIENGRTEKSDAINVMSITLHYPRENVPNVTCIRNLSNRLKDKESLSFRSEPFHHQLLFKEEFHGDSIIEIVMTSVKKAKKLDKFLLNIIGTTVGTAIGGITGLGPIPIAILSQASKSLFELAEPEDEIEIIGKGIFPLHEDMKDGIYPITLITPNEIEINKTVEIQDDKTIIKREVIKKDSGNCEVKLFIKRIP